MPVYQRLVYLDKVFESLKTQAVVVNDVSITTESEKGIFSKLLFQRFGSELVSCVPKCECGATKDAHRLGEICNICGYAVKDPMDQRLEALVWLRAPKQVLALINPIVLLQLRQKFTKSGFSIIDWLLNTDYRPGINLPPDVVVLMDKGVKRGYNNFIQNFDVIIDQLFSLKLTRNKSLMDDDLYKEIHLFKDRIFSQHIPLPNRSLMVVEDNSTGSWVDPVILGALDAVNMLTGIDTPLKFRNERQRQNTTAKALLTLCDFYTGLNQTVFAKKGGLYRKHIYGGRNMYSARAVISSITDPHEYDELHISWGVGVTMLRIHLLNKLMRAPYKLSPREANLKIRSATYTYDADLDKLFQEIIAESEEGGLVCIFQRNPSLEKNSAQRLRITRVKTDPRDPTISLSILVVRGFNADFDGDAMNLILALDNATALSWMALAPHTSMININHSRRLSQAAAMPKPVVTTTNVWLTWPDQQPNAEQLEFMESIRMKD